MRGFLLGISSGGVCLTACAPILVPYLMGEARAVRGDLRLLAAFLAGRLTGYLAFAVVAWSVGALLRPSAAAFSGIVTAAYGLLGVAMILYGVLRPRELCAGSAAGRLARWPALSRPPVFPALLGLLTGLNLCPPFLLAFTEAAHAATLGGSVLFFLAFFLGTSLFFVPLPALGALARHPAVRTVGRLTAVVVGVFYCAIAIASLH